MRDIRPVLRAGALAIADRYNYCVPCRVLEILPAASDYAIDKPFPSTPGSQAVRVQFTASRGPYKRGERMEITASNCYPRDAFFPRRHGARIGYYTVEETR